ncbi:TPA: PolC-type DNA polymerase III [Streptococcus suis]
MDKQALFKQLLEQIQLQDEEILAALDQTKISQVDIYAHDPRWSFVFQSPQRIHPHVYQIFMYHLLTAFASIAQVEVQWLFDQDHLDDQCIIDYWKAVLSVLAYDQPLLRSIMNKANYHIEDGVINMGLAMDNHLQVFKDQFQAKALACLEQLGIQNVSLAYQIDQLLHEQEVQSVQDRVHQDDQVKLQAAIEAAEKKQAQAAKPKEKTTKEGATVIGKDIPANATITPIVDLPENQFRQVIEGYVFHHEIREFRSGGCMLLFKVTDYTSSVTCKLMAGRNIKREALEDIKSGQWLRLEGDMVPDTFTSELEFRPRSVRQITKAQREDKAAEGQKRVELHLHSNMSQMDATNSVTDLINQAAKWGHTAIAITDHGGAQAFPEAYWAGKKAGIKVLFGMEAYVVNDGEPIAYHPQDIDLAGATYVVFDVETTGLSAVYDKIIELAAVKMKDGKVIDTFEAFIDPGHPLSAFTTELTGITDAMVKGAPPEAQVMADFQDFSQGAILVAHNASFDMGFLNKAYVRMGAKESDQAVIDTLALSRLVNKNLKGHRLNNLAKHYGIKLEQHHRAVYDSQTTGYILYKLLEQARDDFQMTHHHQLNDRMGHGDAYKNARPFHVTILAKNQAGLKDLFKIISASNVEYYYRNPRVPRSLLMRHRENLLLGTACADGEIFTTMMQKGYEETAALIEMYDYIELQPKSVYKTLIDQEQISSEKDLETIMHQLVKLGKEKGIPVVATGNVHYLDEKDAIYREILIKSMKMNANRQIHLPPVHFRTTDEMLADFAWMGSDLAQELVVTNSQKIADMIEEVEVIRKDLYTPNMEGADDEIRQLSYEQAYKLYGNPLPEIVEARLEKELHSIISNGFSVIYLISQKLVHKSMEDGYLVGSRGSVGSSLVATMTGITEVNPLAPHYYCKACQYSEFYTQGEVGSGYDLPEKACPQCGQALSREGQDIPFETFLGFKGDKVPDIDLNFSGEYQPRAHAYTKVLFGEDYVYRAGTISTVAEKTAFGYVRGYLETTQEHLPQAEKERLAKGIEGVKRTTGQHPGGIIVIPDYMDVYDFTPVQYPADDNTAEWRTTHFDFHSIHDNVLKLDILGHDDPTMIRKLQDLSGIDPKTIPFNDSGVLSLFASPQVLGVTPEQIFSETGTLGVPEFGTAFVRGMLQETKPSTFAELLQISGLSHGTDVWLGNAQELIKNKVTTLAKVIGCRDDIMVTLMQYGIEDATAFSIMEKVRKGQGIPDEWQDIMRQHKVPEWYIDSCLKIKYMFPKAHAAAYIMMALRVAYFKVYHPLYYYAAYFTVRAGDFDLIAMHQGKEMVKRRLKEIMGKGNDASPKEKSLQVVLEIANEMLERGYHFHKVDIDKSQADEFIIEGDALIPPFSAIPGLGSNVAQQIIKARQEAEFLSKEDLQRRGKVSKTIIEYLNDQGVLDHLPDHDQLTLF